MAEDPKISRRYRDLPREEPPRHVDEAILAAARRAIAGEKRQIRPAPLVVPSGRRRWYFPLAAAAIIVLAVAVTIQVEREQPDPELAAVPPLTAPKAPAEEKALQSRSAEIASAPPATTPALPADKRESSAPQSPEARAPRRQRDAPQAEQDALGGARESARADAAAARQPRAAMERAEAKAGAISSFAEASPEQWLQGIADLRRQGRHDEADKALAEFRRAYPDYRISEAMLEKVERRGEK